MSMETLKQLIVEGVLRNQAQSGYYGLLLREAGGSRQLQIVIGAAEAHSIECMLRGITTPRPLTHDLMASLMRQFGISLEGVIVRLLPGGVYSGQLLVHRDGEQNSNTVVDARCSDAVALALRLDAPVYATEELMNKVGIEIPESLRPRKAARPDSDMRPSLETLRRRLHEAAAAERYEEAARLKREIDSRLDQEKKKNGEGDVPPAHPLNPEPQP